MEKPSIKECFLTVLIFVICTFIGLVFQKFHFSEANVVTIYILGVLLTSILTDGYLCSVAGSVMSVFLFCFFLTEPRMSFQTYAVGYPVTFVIMLISSVLTGTLAAKLKMHARLSAQLAFRTQILFDTDRLLQKARSQKEILEITCTQLARLFDRSIVAYAAVNGRLAEGHLFSEKEKAEDQSYLTLDEQQIARWVYTNKKRAGATTHYYKNSKCLYLAIRIGDQVYGVIGVPAQKDVLDSFEYSILLSVLNGCALAMDNARNAEEKEKNAVIAKNEQLRADLLRAISHDLRTPLTSIIGSSSSYLENGSDMTEYERTELVSNIKEDSEWLLNMVENLLTITRIDNNSQDKVKKSPEVVEEVVSEAIQRLRKRLSDVRIKVHMPNDFLMIPMDATLIEQVLINLLENASVHSESTEEIDLIITQTKECVSFSVRDYGKGIDPEQLPYIFEGQRSSGKNSDHHKGIGIGLSICKTIIEAHGGKLTAVNHKHGAEFIFTLPKEKEVEANA